MEVEAEFVVQLLGELLGVHLVVTVFVRLVAGVAFVPVVAGLWLWLTDRVAHVRFPLADAALVAAVVLELREVHDFDGDVNLVRETLTEVAVLDELREVLAAVLADFTVPFEVVSQSHL